MIPFCKLHGLGNDFVLIDETSTELVRSILKRKNLKAFLRALADRKTGVGFDQFLLLRAPSKKATQARLHIFNADGSVAEMCGNGLRAAALYLWRQGRVREELVFETDAGIRKAIKLKGGLIECEMGVPKLLKIPAAFKDGVVLAGNQRAALFVVDSGVPHAVVFAKPRNSEELAKWGSMIENHRAFPKRTNVNFVEVLAAGRQQALRVMMWERGVGITEACGTGAVAVVVAARAAGKISATGEVEVRFAGGKATVLWKGPGKPAYLRGTASFVFDGQLD